MAQGRCFFVILSIKSKIFIHFLMRNPELLSRYQRTINIKKAIYQPLTKQNSHVSLITRIFVNNPNSLTCKAFVFLGVKQALINEFTG